MTGCTYDAAGCLVCPEIPAQPAQPAQVITDPLLGWNAGANSITVLDGDLRVADTLDALPTGIVIGLKASRAGPTAPELITHGLYLYAAAGKCFVEVRESGLRVGTPQALAIGDTFEIRREAGRVSYWLAGVHWMHSARRSTGPVLVNACLYSAGDSLP